MNDGEETVFINGVRDSDISDYQVCSIIQHMFFLRKVIVILNRDSLKVSKQSPHLAALLHKARICWNRTPERHGMGSDSIRGGGMLP